MPLNQTSKCVLYGRLKIPSFLLNWSVSVTIVRGQTVNQTLNVEINTAAVIPCSIAKYDYPGWSGQPPTTNGGFTPYNWDRSSSFFTSLTNQARLSWAANNRELVLSNVIRQDEGTYQCVVNGGGAWTVQLNVFGIVTFVSFFVAKHKLNLNDDTFTSTMTFLR